MRIFPTLPPVTISRRCLRPVTRFSPRTPSLGRLPRLPSITDTLPVFFRWYGLLKVSSRSILIACVSTIARRGSMKPCPYHTEGNLEKQLYFSPVRPTVHTNPSRKRSFSITLFKPEEFENASFLIPRGQTIFWKRSHDNQWYPWASFSQT